MLLTVFALGFGVYLQARRGGLDRGVRVDSPLDLLSFRTREIHEAIRLKDWNRVKTLVAKNPKLVHAPDDRGHQPLHLAVGRGYKKLVAFLISRGADVNAHGGNKMTPLHLARDIEIAELLVKSGADLSATNASGRTPLQEAVEDENQEMVAFLVSAGAKLDFESLVRLGRASEVATILQQKPWLAKPPHKPLFAAVRSGNLQVVKLLLAHDAEPDDEMRIVNLRRYTPLSEAVAHGHYEISKLLLDHGAKPNAAVHSYLRVLHYAVARCDDRFVDLLLQYGADVNYQDRLGPSPLHIAANRGSVEKAKLLLDFGGEINPQTPDGATPLFFAAVAGHKAFCEFLLSRGARLDVHSACSLGKREEVKEMLERDPTLANARDGRLHRTPLFGTAKSGDVKLVELLLANDAEVNARAPVYLGSSISTGPTALSRPHEPYVGETPLHVAAKAGNEEIVCLLLDRGADINAQDDRGATPLHQAVYAGHESVVRLLLDRGAAIIESKAKLLFRTDNQEIFELLLDRTGKNGVPAGFDKSPK